ncbi:iron ABC transporter permease [Nocardioides cavernae]|uniref:ABC transporter permease n=1 Tax=Nocardioides TaxID=1839 RepID=UPI000A81C042|nr:MULTISPECIES: iron ABC transporter permease [Nocardioides]MCK9823488.1 iron ABC transporter permease [Nocardioides cavernae]
MALLALVPLGYVATYVLIIGPGDLWDLVARPRIAELLRNTVTLAAACMSASVVLGVALAVVVERTDLPGRRLWHGLLVAPLAVPAFVNGYAWISLDRSVHGFGGAFLVVTLSYYPLVYLPVVAMLRRLDPALEESAWSLGHSRARTFRTVVLPQLRPALLGGALLVGLHLLAEFGALSLLRFPTFTTAIYDQYGSTFNGAAATAMAGVLVLLCLFLLLAELRLRGDRRYARVGRGAARASVPVELGRWRAPALAALAAVVVLAIGVPAFSLLRWLAVGTSTEFPMAELTRALVATIVLALAGAVVTTLAAVPVVWLAVRHRGVASTVIERSTYVANALPGIVVGLALVVASLRLVPVVYQTAGLLVAAYAILFLPRAVVTVRAGLEQAPAVLDDVSHSLGVGPLATARRVTLPLIAPSLGAGAALVFLAISTELTATLMLSPIGTRTLATEFWSASSELRYGAAAPYALLLVLVSIPATLLLMRSDSPATQTERVPV